MSGHHPFNPTALHESSVLTDLVSQKQGPVLQSHPDCSELQDVYWVPWLNGTAMEARILLKNIVVGCLFWISILEHVLLEKELSFLGEILLLGMCPGPDPSIPSEE